MNSKGNRLLQESGSRFLFHATLCIPLRIRFTAALTEECVKTGQKIGHVCQKFAGGNAENVDGGWKSRNGLHSTML